MTQTGTRATGGQHWTLWGQTNNRDTHCTPDTHSVPQIPLFLIVLDWSLFTLHSSLFSRHQLLHRGLIVSGVWEGDGKIRWQEERWLVMILMIISHVIIMTLCSWRSWPPQRRFWLISQQGKLVPSVKPSLSLFIIIKCWRHRLNCKTQEILSVKLRRSCEGTASNDYWLLYHVRWGPTIFGFNSEIAALLSPRRSLRLRSTKDSR